MWIICMTTDTDGCHVDYLYDNWYWRLPCGIFVWQPTLTAAMWIICITTDSDGCHLDYLYDNRQWRLPCGIFEWQPTLTVAMWIVFMTTDTGCCYLDYLYDNRHWQLPCGIFVWQPTVTAAMTDICLGNHGWRLPSRNLPWQPWLTVAKQSFALETMTDGCQVEFFQDWTGCQVEFCLGNHEWRLPRRILPRQTWLTVAKQTLGLATMTDGRQADIELGNHDFVIHGKMSWIWQINPK